MNSEKNYKPAFEISKLDYYFHNGTIEYDPRTQKEHKFDNLIVYDKNDCFWKQNCVRYELVDDTEVINHFKSYFENSLSFLNSGTKNKILEAYRQYGRQKYNDFLEIPKYSVVFNNALIYLGNNNLEEIIDRSKLLTDEQMSGNIVYAPYNSFFVTNPIPYNLHSSEEKSCPKIHQLFVDWVGEKNVDILYEIIGYSMLPDNPLQEAVILNGYGSNGKTTFCKILQKIIGKENCTATDIFTLTETNFGVAQLYKKLVCFIGETDGHRLDKTSILKRLVGEDEVPAQFKNKPNFTFKNYAKVIISTNTIPQTGDKSDGFYRRWLIVDFPNQFTEKKDVLSDIPEEEYEALANICLDKLKNLLISKRFTNEPSLQEKRTVYEEKSNPLQTFISKFYEITENPEDQVFSYQFYSKYELWARNHGYSIIPTQKSITAELHEMNINSERRIDYSKEDKPRYYAFTGIKEKIEESTDLIQITQAKSYSKEEIVDIIRKKDNLPKDYSEDKVIELYKKGNRIYEPKSGEYKFINGEKI